MLDLQHKVKPFAGFFGCFEVGTRDDATLLMNNGDMNMRFNLRSDVRLTAHSNASELSFEVKSSTPSRSEHSTSCDHGSKESTASSTPQ